MLQQTIAQMIDMLVDPTAPTVFWLLTLHCINGLLAAIVAQRKGYSGRLWLVLGLIGGTVALVLALAKTNVNPS